MCYQNALSMNPYHIQSLKQLAVVLAEMKQFNLSEKMIQDAIAINSSLPELWNILAQILEFLEDNQSAMKCFQTCIQLEATDPILPFTSLTRLFWVNEPVNQYFFCLSFFPTDQYTSIDVFIKNIYIG